MNASAQALVAEKDEGPSEKAIEAATARLRLDGRLVGSVFPGDELKGFNDPLRKKVLLQSAKRRSRRRMKRPAPMMMAAPTKIEPSGTSVKAA